MFIGNQKCRAAPLGAEPCEVGGVSLAAELYAFSAARLRGRSPISASCRNPMWRKSLTSVGVRPYAS
jgi:hypothetical protein